MAPQAQPLAPGVAVYALVFGALAGERGLSWLQAVLMSTFVYSGSAQLAALQVWSTQSQAVLALVVTVLAINARYVLYGASMHTAYGLAGHIGRPPVSSERAKDALSEFVERALFGTTA